MKLKPAESHAILAGDHPELIRPHEGKCPFEVGETVVLRSTRSIAGPVPQVSIEVVGKHRKSPTSWEAIYSVKDERGLYLGKGSGYTRSASQSIDSEAPVDDPEALERYVADGRLKTALSGAEHRFAGARRSREAKVRAAGPKGLRTLERVGKAA